MSHLIVAPLPGGVQPRLEINNFVKDDRQFSLYVQALNRMYQVDQAQVPSYFQVAGIHGLPFTPYDGASISGFTANPSEQWAGYCTHGSTLFPTWHRPYVMLAEQIINSHAQQIAGTYTKNKAAWQDAATKLRQPYWDWASNIIPPPEVIDRDNVEITVPNGSRRNVTNPLKRYKFHPIEPTFQRPYSRWQTTLRQPDGDGRNAKDNINQLKATLGASQRTTTSGTYSMLTRIHTWDEFSSHTSGKGSANSVESLHDNIHVLVGGNGHMSDPSVAAFDPIFWLHHTNVDRLISLWSAINPDLWMTPGDAQDGTFTLRSFSSVNDQTPLTPFWKTQTQFWLSNQVKDFTSLGYTYPEFVGKNMGDKQALKTAISQQVNNLYGPDSSPMRRRSLEGGAESYDGDITHQNIGRGIQKRHQQLAQRSRFSDLLKSGKYSDWNARVRVKRSEVQHSFSVIFFLDEVPQNPKEWLTSDNFVGAHHAFIHSMKCTECDKHDVVEEGFVPLNPALMDKSDILSFAAQVVEPFLSRLLWRALSTTGEEIQLQSLDVSIIETVLNVLPGKILPDVGDIITHGNITLGQS